MGSFLAVLADVDGEDLSTLFIVAALLCILGAAYLAYLRNVVGAVLLAFIAVVAVVIGT